MEAAAIHFGATLRLLRVNAGLSLRELAGQLGVSSAYLSRVENGHDAPPTPDRLVQLARALGQPPDLLLDLAGRVSTVVGTYLQRQPAAGALFLEVARRQLGAAEIAELRAWLDARFPGAPEASSGRLSELLDPSRVVLELMCGTFDEALEIAAIRLAPAARVTARELRERLLHRESTSPTAIGAGIALPHASVEGAAPAAALLCFRHAPQLDTPDQIPVGAALVLVAAPHEAPALVARAARLAHAGLATRLKGVTEPARVLEELRLLETMHVPPRKEAP